MCQFRPCLQGRTHLAPPMCGDSNGAADASGLGLGEAPQELVPQGVHLIGASVRGATHLRRGLPNQDSWGAWCGEEGAWPVVVAVADGHGSARSPRSDRGSRFAVEIALEIGREWLRSAADERLSLGELTFQLQDRIPKQIVARWRLLVEADLSVDPPSEAGSNLLVQYGTTLVLFLTDGRRTYALQLGDGEILMSRSSEEPYRPLPADERLFANETTSLSSDAPWKDFRVFFDHNGESAWDFVLLTTDGYPNSFQDDGGFIAAAADIKAAVRAEGLDGVAAELPGWLREASDLGSGDDATVVLVARR